MHYSEADRDKMISENLKTLFYGIVNASLSDLEALAEQIVDGSA